MKRSLKIMSGVTLLEIMLVLAIAAFLIVFSVRYYQNAMASQNANAAAGMINAITAAADNLAVGSGSYSGLSTSKIQTLMPNKSMQTPWNSAVTITPVGATSYTVSLGTTPANICPLIASKFSNDKHYSSISACGATGAEFKYTYLSNPS